MSGKSTDLTNKTFGKLKVVKRAENSSSGQPRWLCECRCGKTCIVDGRFLKNGAVKSVGVYREVFHKVKCRNEQWHNHR